MAHPLVLALYSDPSAAAAGARAAHSCGVTRDQLSIVARSHDEEGALAAQMDGTPGADIEDSRPAALVGELSAFALAAIAIAMPGIGPIVAAGPLAAGLGEAAGHAAGSVASVMREAGVAAADAEAVEREIDMGAVLLGIHCTEKNVDSVRDALSATGTRWLSTAHWKDS